MKRLASVLVAVLALVGAASAQVTYSGQRGVHVSSYGGSRGYASSRVWVAGRYETVCQQVWVPGCSERVWVQPVFALRYDSCGRAVRVQIAAGYWRTLHHPGHYESRSVRVWQPGHWAPRGSC